MPHLLLSTYLLSHSMNGNNAVLLEIQCYQFLSQYLLVQKNYDTCQTPSLMISLCVNEIQS